MALYYLSFASDDGWLGACYVEASSAAEALMFAGALDILPPADDGEAAVWDVSDLASEIPAMYRGRLLNKSDLHDIDRLSGGEGEVVGGTVEQQDAWLEAGEAPPSVITPDPRRN